MYEEQSDSVSNMAEDRMSNSMDSHIQIGQVAQWIEKVPLGIVSALDREWRLGVAGNRI